MPGPGDAAASSSFERHTGVRRRHLLYVGGFDPQGPAHYHGLYTREGAKQAAVSGYALTVGRRERAGAHSAAWSVHWADDQGQSCDTTYEFLRWDDIVRQHWPKGQWRLMAMSLASTWRMLRNGSLWRMLQTSWPAFLAIAAPALTLVGAAMLAGLLLIVTLLATRQTGQAAWWLLLVVGLPAIAGFTQWLQQKVQTAWLMRSATVILQQARGEMPDLEQRLDAFAARLAQVCAQPDADEVLVVGHSSGAMLAISMLARALPDPLVAAAAATGRLQLLTLGQCVPVLSYQPEATAFRAEIGRLRQSPAPKWLDVTAPPDGCCFALSDPSMVSLDGLPAAPPGDTGGAKCLSPRFAQLFPAQAYQAVRRDKYRCHFQYLMAGQQRGDYDFFAISAGPLALDARFAAQPGVTGFRDFQRFGSPAR